MEHEEASEKTVATVKGVVGGSLNYAQFSIEVNGKAYSFGSVASFTDRRFQVDGRTDAVEPVEEGDRITVIAAGQARVEFVLLGSKAVAASYEALIPDNTKPAAPKNLEPTKDATGVTVTPVFKWGTVSDPSGITYTLQWSIDQTFSLPAPATTTKAGLSAPTYSVQAGTDEQLQPGTNYYWRAVAHDGAQNVGAQSEVWGFATG